jgi:hypothetical protein
MTGLPRLGNLWTSADATLTLIAIVCAESHDGLRQNATARTAAAA